MITHEVNASSIVRAQRHCSTVFLEWTSLFANLFIAFIAQAALTALRDLCPMRSFQPLHATLSRPKGGQQLRCPPPSTQAHLSTRPRNGYNHPSRNRPTAPSLFHHTIPPHVSSYPTNSHAQPFHKFHPHNLPDPHPSTHNHNQPNPWNQDHSR